MKNYLKNVPSIPIRIISSLIFPLNNRIMWVLTLALNFHFFVHTEMQPKARGDFEFIFNKTKYLKSCYKLSVTYFIVFKKKVKLLVTTGRHKVNGATTKWIMTWNTHVGWLRDMNSSKLLWDAFFIKICTNWNYFFPLANLNHTNSAMILVVKLKRIGVSKQTSSL